MLSLFQFDSLRYGLIGSFRTNKPIKAGEQIFSDYGYRRERIRKMFPHEWFYDEWQDFKSNYPDHWKVQH
jgi:hypothetical protein